ncbi:MAG TPA: NAD(P)H-binding protein [Candidatus Accumulibacter phosphatis]|nr:MAG: NAD dependent epimerase/dehydratase family protein [Candidatus Accumulibacter sp. SK-11]HAY27662.1 NAD(P)-dependent oxidoreductase [Accumulibacter sp.]HCN67716.1 NAD(P)-dependent oxidoreductase [Accumulibacter sp.]HRL75009.1 NAD(P)H-binding protein [Candidatus Accumulibacter phosphatis]HRQ93555.1 NAD(P)H-binding protein [Candidatus Accumulibacter phosphatis]
MRRLLIVGCGDVARRMLPHLLGHYRIFALIRDREQGAFWRARGARPVLADLDQPHSLRRIAGLADLVVHLAPPPSHDGKRPASDRRDPRTRWLLAALARGRSLPQRIVYISTTGVYGDCGGELIDETRPLRPTTARAHRRVDAERRLRLLGRRGVVVSILRAPGIYAADRLPIERLRKGSPALCDADDVYSNHIHADDLALLACAALRYGRSNRTYNASDDSRIRMGEYFDLVADHFDLPRVPRVSRREAEALLSPLQLSFMSESRRLLNRRARKELRARLRYPQVADGVRAAARERNSGC